MTREGVAVLLTTSRSKENLLSSRRRRLDIDEKNHLHCTCPMGRLSILFLSPPDSTFFAARSAMLSALNETPSAPGRYAVGWQLLAQAIHDDVLIEKDSDECPQLLRPVNGCRSVVGSGALTGYIKQAAALNAWRVSTRSTLNLWPGNQSMALSICLCSSHRHFPKRLVFSSSGPDLQPAGAGHAD